MERGNSDGLSQQQPLLILSRIQNADTFATSLIALLLSAFTLFPGTGSYWVWPRWHQAFSQQDLITLQSKAGVTHPRLLYLSLVMGAMGCIVPGPFALLHAHWSLQVEAVLKDSIAVESADKEGSIFLRKRMASFIHVINVGCLACVGVAWRAIYFT